MLRKSLADMVVIPISDVQKGDYAAGYDNPLDTRSCCLTNDIEGSLNCILMRY